jgi:hypothetical protein
MRTTDLFAWQFDGHRVVVAEDPHGDLEITPYCPGLADGATPWCRVPQTYGGLLRSTLDPASWCAFDHWWSDPPGDWLADGYTVGALTAGVWEIAWKVDESRQEPIWMPWVQVAAVREPVTA